MFSFLILSNLLNIGKNCCELRSEKREVLLVSFSDFAHFVFAIIKRFESENQHDDFFLYLFGIMFFLMFYSQYGYYKKQGDWAQELCAPHPYWYIFFGVCLWIAAFGIILKKCLE